MAESVQSSGFTPNILHFLTLFLFSGSSPSGKCIYSTSINIQWVNLLSNLNIRTSVISEASLPLCGYKRYCAVIVVSN